MEDKVKEFIKREFQNNVVPALSQFVAIPNCSKDFDPEWNTNGLLEKAANHLINWGNSQKIQNLDIQLMQDENLTPFIYAELPKSQQCKSDKTIIFYGHFDKQPPMLPWADGLDPFIPVLRDGKLYGRGSADDGYIIQSNFSYSFFASILSVKALQENNIPHCRCVFLFEGDEETGSGDVEHYIEKLQKQIGTNVGLIVVMDSGCLNYDSLWVTTNLRGVIETKLKVSVLTEGVHSGDASGVVPSSFRILRNLLDRIENPKTGQIVDDFQVIIPPNRYQEAFDTVNQVQEALIQKYPWANGMQPVYPKNRLLDNYLNRTWKAQLAITGQDGIPKCQMAGNVLRPSTTLKLSLRIPPSLDYKQAIDTLQNILEKDPPYNAVVKVEESNGGGGFNSKPFSAELWQSMNSASLKYYGQPCLALGEGGSIPFMNFLQELFPEAQFMITGVLGPNSNAHGPNEFLHLAYCEKLICCMTKIVGDFV